MCRDAGGPTWQALKLHLEASHERFAFQFVEDEADTVPEVYVDVVTEPPAGLKQDKGGELNACVKVRALHRF